MIGYHVRFSEEAQHDLTSLRRYLGTRFGARPASQFTQRLRKACVQSRKVPFCGTSRNDLSPGLRLTGFERRGSIYFSVGEEREEVVIIALRYGGRFYRQT